MAHIPNYINRKTYTRCTAAISHSDPAGIRIDVIYRDQVLREARRNFGTIDESEEQYREPFCDTVY